MNHAKRDLGEELAAWKGPFPSFLDALREQGARYLSFSRVKCVESCQVAFRLEYVEHVELSPTPSYFVKGGVFHDAVSRMYLGHASGCPVSQDGLLAHVDCHWDDADAHLKNAVRLAMANAWTGFDVVAVEEAFVMELPGGLPPLIGQIDLLLRQGNRFTVVDHKTGSQFTVPDPMQLVIYREHVRSRYQADHCAMFFDSYRWVKNLRRIKIPAFQRTEIQPQPGDWEQTLQRLAAGYREMSRIEEGGRATPREHCYQCQYRSVCPEARSRRYQGWY